MFINIKINYVYKHYIVNSFLLQFKNNLKTFETVTEYNFIKRLKFRAFS